MKKWMLRRNKVNIQKMAERLGISVVTAQVLANRGIGTYNDACKFLYCDVNEMYDGYLLKDMQKGIDVINAAVNAGKKIAVYGDYDVDGVMSTTILYKTLKAFTDNVIYYVPHRQKEGYGINLEAVEKLKAIDVKVVLTCDNGIASIEEAKRIEELGMSLVILDHHEPSFEVDEDGIKKDIIPVAAAVIDHKQKDCTYPFKALCAGAMAYKFSKLFFEKRNIEFVFKTEFLVFAAMATICDIVDLLDENRIIAKNGLDLIKKSPNIGLKALIEKTGIADGDISEYHIGFVLGPCINATGRLKSATTSVELFVTEDIQKATTLASELTELNNERKLLTATAEKEAIAAVENSDLQQDRVLVIYNENIHESIAGIVAGKIKERYYKPVIMLTSGESMAKGSARSIEGYNIFEELFKQRDLFHKFGGHPMAAGLSLANENVDILRKRLNQVCTLTEEEMTPVLKIEKSLTFDEITMEAAQQLLRIAPFGKENPMPIFGTKGITAEKVMLIGKDKNIMKISLRDTQTGIRIDGISFDGLEEFEGQCLKKYGEKTTRDILNGTKSTNLDIVYNININCFSGRTSLQLILKGFRL
jgi:single-stranded-DNA-specific exonuclease RecJ